MIIRKSSRELALLSEAGKIVASVLEEIKKFSRPGVSTEEIDDLANKLILENDAEPAFLGYHGFPASICASINEEVVHGIPGKRKLNEGDLLSLDVGVKYKGYFADAALTTPVGQVSKSAQDIIKATRQSLYDGIEQAKIGNRLFDISAAIQKTAESKGYSVVRDFVGHGIGQQLHEEPQVPNFGEPGKGPELKEGMVLALEPMLNQGGYEVRMCPDRWTVVTKDGKISAHFEHTVAITKEGPKILTNTID